MLDARKALPWKVTHASKWVSSRSGEARTHIGRDGIILASARVQPVLPHKSHGDLIPSAIYVLNLQILRSRESAGDVGVEV